MFQVEQVVHDFIHIDNGAFAIGHFHLLFAALLVPFLAQPVDSLNSSHISALYVIYYYNAST